MEALRSRAPCHPSMVSGKIKMVADVIRGAETARSVTTSVQSVVEWLKVPTIGYGVLRTQ